MNTLCGQSAEFSFIKLVVYIVTTDLKGLFCVNRKENERVVMIIQQTLANPVTDNPDRNMKNEKFCSQLNIYFKRHVGFRSKRTFRLC
jgi:hypothetical protein